MTDQLEQFVTDSTRTESVIDSVHVNEQLLTGIVQCMIRLGNVLDQIKKHTFYDKPIDNTETQYHLAIAADTLNTLKDLQVTEQKQTLPVNPRIFHGVLGIVTEGVELLEAMDLYSSMDNVNVLEEVGDVFWYCSILSDELGVPLEDIMDTVIAKLKQRFPDKFNTERAVTRELTAEREILESNLDARITDPFNNES